jgi:hypothetical protein
VVSPAHGNQAVAATLQALERQTRAPDQVVTAATANGETRWLWLLDGSAVPEPGALESLLEVAERPDPLPSPVLLASKVVMPDGSPDPGSLPVARFLDPDLAVAAVERRVLSIRIARRGSLLVDSRVLEGVDSFDLDLEWTSRVLKGRPGVLVPASVAVRRSRVEPRRPELRGLLELVVGAGLETREKPWYGFRLAEEMLAARRRG